MAVAEKSFQDFRLDDRLAKGIADLGWKRPTLIQEKAIPLALEGKDILARAQTGSGKTGAYAIPVIQKILQDKVTKESTEGVKALILTPSKELCQQTTINIQNLCSKCSKEVMTVNVLQNIGQKFLQMNHPDIVVATPGKALNCLQSKVLRLKNTLRILVVDEADLTFSYGFEEDMKKLLPFLPQIFQAFLMSATLSEDVLSLKKLILHNPVTLKLEESDLPSADRLSQYHIKCSQEDKFLLIYALLKLRLVTGKTLIFVNNIDMCYRVKLFLDQFGIQSCVLNSELPQNSRQHLLNEFNRGVYDYIIASDETEEGPLSSDSKAKKKSKRYQKDSSYGVSRGIDFKHVDNVINYDFPSSPEAYIHRVGRTARGFDVGIALSLVSPNEEHVLQLAEAKLTGGAVNETPVVVKPYKFKMAEVEGFRYRINDALKVVNRTSVREARLKEIRTEILNSEKLKVFFEDNPRDLQVLRHDKALQPKKIQSHLKHIPSYLVPKSLKSMTNEDSSSSLSKAKRRKIFQRKSRTNRRKTKDPLKTFTHSKS